MKIEITLEREGDALKATATSTADEWGSKVAYTVWAHADTAQVANLVGRAVIGAGLPVPDKPAAEEFRLTLDQWVNVPERDSSASERDVAVDGDSPSMRKLLTHAVAKNLNVRLDYTDGQGNKSTDRTIAPVALDWSGTTRSPSRALIALDKGVRKTFYLSRIDRAEIL